MDDRKFLEKIRQLQRSGKQISLTEIEDTKVFKKDRKLLFEEDLAQTEVALQHHVLLDCTGRHHLVLS